MASLRIAGELRAHLDQWEALPFVRPATDCCFFVADWVLSRTGVDPAPDLRGSYCSALGARRKMRMWGGFETMWRVHMALAGFNTTRAPEMGDVGVVRDRGGQMIAAIRIPGAWAAKAERGLLYEDMPMIVAWSLSRG